MNRITLFVDMAGQRNRKFEGNPRVTSAAVALPTADLDDIRAQLPTNLSKWERLTEEMAGNVVDMLSKRAVAVAAATVNRDTVAWTKALVDEEILHSQIASESRAKAGWAKLPIVLAYELLSRACFLALAHFLREDRSVRILDSQGLCTIECRVICDEEFSGEENIDVFKSFWNEEHIPAKELAALGFRVRHPDVSLTTEKSEPLLLLADISAGLVHSASLPDPGRVAMPLPCAVARKLLSPLRAKRLLSIDAFDFDMNYDEVFGNAMEEARARKDA